jgi:dihydroorotase
MSARLDHREQPGADLLIRGAHVLDPRAGIDAPHDVLVRGGEIAEIAEPGSVEAPEGAEILEGEGRHLLPGFVDPHVHLRTPGQEHKEDLDSGTRAAAAGGYVAVVAMPNTDPVIDSAPLLRSLREAARREARIPVGFMASITRGLAGEALTEMAELASAGALGFTDDGKPVHRAGILRKALQYQRLAGRIICLHEEDPSLSGRGVMHEGEVSARLGLAGIPSISESTLIARDAALAGYEEGRIHIQHLSARESVEAVAEAKARGVRITAEASPHHLTLTHDALRERLDTRLKMNPPLRSEDDRQALIAGDRPRATRPRGEGGALRGGADGHHRARDRVRRALHRPGAAGRAAARADRRPAVLGRRARRAAAAGDPHGGGGELLPRGPRSGV